MNWKLCAYINQLKFRSNPYIKNNKTDRRNGCFGSSRTKVNVKSHTLGECGCEKEFKINLKVDNDLKLS